MLFCLRFVIMVVILTIYYISIVHLIAQVIVADIFV